MYIILIYEELTYWKRPWCWEGLGAGGEGDDRGWDGWMVSPTRWTWVWVNSGSWWWTGRPGMLRFMGSQRVGHDWVTELNWTELNIIYCVWLLSHFSYVWLCPALWTLACQVPLCTPGKNTGVDCYALLQEICLIQGLNPRLLCLLHCRQTLYRLSHQRNIIIAK